MAFARAASVALVGVTGHIVEVEAHLAPGIPGLVITGLPDTAVGEARDRVRAAVLNSGEDWPLRRMTVGLGPAWLPKHGTGFDVAVGIAILAAAQVVPAAALAGVVLLAELGLDGRVRPVRGVLPAVLAAVRCGRPVVVVSSANAHEARLVPGARVVGVDTLAELVAALRAGLSTLPTGTPPTMDCSGDAEQPARAEPSTMGCAEQPGLDLADVVGQDLGKLAIEVAAAGGHHIALFGPPGAGKTMLAERLPGLLPPLELDEALEVTAIHSVAGNLPPASTLITRAPYQAPHHTASVAALVGGGSGVARPGAISLATNGVLFLDEATEFPSRVLDALRQPLERREIVIARAGGIARYPAAVQLVLAANPCPCASPAGDSACVCSAAVRRRYMSRLSGPLLDRIDIQVELFAVRANALLADPSQVETTAVVAGRVRRAREAAAGRWRPEGWRTNAEIPGSALRAKYRLPRAATAAIDAELERGFLSARGHTRVQRLAWSLADLAGRSSPNPDDVHEAMFLRTRRAV